MCEHNNNNPNKTEKQTKRLGSTLSDKKAHQADHKKWSRRSFLSTLGLTGSLGLFLGKFPMAAMAASPLQAALAGAETDRVLVIVRMKGGNDGLNTFVPLYDYGFYNNKRPTLAIPENEIINLTNEIGLPNFMQNLEGFWENGQMRVAHSVGYPNQNLSHFGSSDVWASANDPDTPGTTGWLGRFFDNQYPDFLVNPPDIPPALQIGSGSNLLFRGTDTDMAISVANPQELYEIAQTGALYDVEDVPDCYYGEQLAFTRTIINNTFTYSEAIKNAYEASTTDADYTVNFGTRFAEQMAIVARLIKGNLGTKVYMVEIGGFDTHEGQADAHPFLMETIATAMKAFYEDLAVDNLDTKVLSMTISEFGRRIEENGSLGTDHGAAAPLMMFSGGLEGNGFYGNAPDLQNPDEEGNLQFDLDFRSIYATVLENWLCVDAATVDAVLGNSYTRIEGLMPDCIATSAPIIAKPITEHRALYGNQGIIRIQYHLSVATRTKVDVFNISGQHIRTLFEGNQAAGQHQVLCDFKGTQIPFGQYIYRIQAGNQVYSKPISVFH